MNERNIIATLPVLERVVPSLNEAAPAAEASIEGLTPVQRAALQAGLNNALGALQDAAKDGVLFSPQNKIAALLQSMVAENATSLEPISGTDALEAKFDTHDWTGWLGTFWLMLNPPAKFVWKDPPPAPETIPQFGNSARLAVFGDWGTGLYGAPVIANSIRDDPEKVDIVMHLGDVYYSGSTKEFRARFSDCWPERPGALNRALNGNHEMYSGGAPYWDVIHQHPFNQAASCFAYRNDYWIIAGLDTAFVNHDLAQSQADWLNRIVAAADGRRIVLFSHHQPFSLLSTQGPKLVDKLRPLLEGHKIFAWYWGHEHECVLYDQHPGWALYGRCIGNAGMPEFRPKLMGSPVPKVQFRHFDGGNGVPGAWILDGPNQYIKREEKKFSPHSYLTLDLDGNRIVERIRNPDGTELRSLELR